LLLRGGLQELYARNGIQKLVFNTVYQLMADVRYRPEILEKAETDSNVRFAYTIMQKQYVLRLQDQIPYEDAISSLKCIHQKLLENEAWRQASAPIKSKSDRDER
jgi:hypothetical protein